MKQILSYTWSNTDNILSKTPKEHDILNNKGHTSSLGPLVAVFSCAIVSAWELMGQKIKSGQDKRGFKQEIIKNNTCLTLWHSI
jgi:hypothetical protein